MFYRGKSEPREAKMTYRRSPNSCSCQGKNSGACCGRSWTSQGKLGQSSESPPSPQHYRWARHCTADALGCWIPTALNVGCYTYLQGQLHEVRTSVVAERLLFKRTSWPLITILKLMFWTKDPTFYFTLNPTNYVADSNYLYIIDISIEA